MRRYVKAAGGYYSRQSRNWVIPGARHNCTPWDTPAHWHPTLADAYRAADAAAEANRRVKDFGDRESAHLVRNW